MTRVLLYGDVDLNLIDGSAIWLASLAEVLGGIPAVSVTVLQKTRITRPLVIQSAAALPNVSFLDPWTVDTRNHLPPKALSSDTGGRITPEKAAALIAYLDCEKPFDLLLIRSLEVSVALADLLGASRRLWTYVTDPLRYTAAAERARLRGLFLRCDRVLCQTEEAKAALQNLLGLEPSEKVLLLPPMIPTLAVGPPPALDPAAPRLGYSGKFSPPYMILEMLDAFDKIRATIPGAEFHVVGDKFHSAPPVPEFVETVKRRLSTTAGVFWHGGVSRKEANNLLSQVHIASSWRAPVFDDTVEMSTKVLEYSGLGIPVLMNPSAVQRRVFGADYPAYVTTEDEFIQSFLTLTRSQGLYRHLADSVRTTASQFTFESVRRRLEPLLPKPSPPAELTACLPTILWVGHDFKFLRPIQQALESSGQFATLTDVQPGHVIQNHEQSHRQLERADVIFCEWCLGNAEWYAQHKKPGQRLVIRLHRQEIELPFLERIRWENVDRIIFITEWVKRRFVSMFPAMKDRALLIYNALDCGASNVEKLFGAEFNLGLLGFCPKLKAPHLAFELLTRLKQFDRRYTLFIKGRHPARLDWLWRRPDERRYYEKLFERIKGSPYANSIVFDPHGEDVPGWFSKVGFVLSTSELEGSHQAVAEGMASGAIPVIRNWFGANDLYPAKYIFSTAGEAVDLVRLWNTPAHYQTEGTFCREWAQRFDLRSILKQYRDMLSDLLCGRIKDFAHF